MAKKLLTLEGLTTYTTQIKDKFVQKDGTKVLSTNDYTTVDKDKLAGVEDAAQVNKIEKVKVNGVEAAINSKAVDITVPSTVAQLTDADDYAKKTDLANITVKKTEVADIDSLFYENKKQETHSICGSFI